MVGRWMDWSDRADYESASTIGPRVSAGEAIMEPAVRGIVMSSTGGPSVWSVPGELGILVFCRRGARRHRGAAARQRTCLITGPCLEVF